MFLACLEIIARRATPRIISQAMLRPPPLTTKPAQGTAPIMIRY